MYMMKRFILAYILLTLLLVLLCSGCSTISSAVFRDPRCVPNQWCAYTDPPPAIRTSVLRSPDPAVR